MSLMIRGNHILITLQQLTVVGVNGEVGVHAVVHATVEVGREQDPVHTLHQIMVVQTVMVRPRIHRPVIRKDVTVTRNLREIDSFASGQTCTKSIEVISCSSVECLV